MLFRRVISPFKMAVTTTTRVMLLLDPVCYLHDFASRGFPRPT